ncbi:MAG: hypothetical protein ACREBB_06115 [Nitrosotalea sp.]
MSEIQVKEDVRVTSTKQTNNFFEQYADIWNVYLDELASLYSFQTRYYRDSLNTTMKIFESAVSFYKNFSLFWGMVDRVSRPFVYQAISQTMKSV